MKSCIILVSGGIDSTVMLAKARERNYGEIYALSFDYNQRHRRELEFAAAQGKIWGVARHEIVNFNMAPFGGSSLTDSALAVPDRSREGNSGGIPNTYVPARNTIFLSFGLAWGESLGVGEIWIGANRMDYTGYPDCRPEYVEKFEEMANISTAKAIEGKLRFSIEAPLINMAKEEIFAEGARLGVDFSLTSSCYNPDEKGRACGRCDACKIRLNAFQNLKMKDPVEYR